MVDIANDDIGENNRLKLWEMMLKLRLVEKKAYDLFLQNLIKGTSHLALGKKHSCSFWCCSSRRRLYFLHL